MDDEYVPSPCGRDDGCFDDASPAEQHESASAQFDMQEGYDPHHHAYAVRRMRIGNGILRLYVAHGAAMLDISTPHDGTRRRDAPRVWLLMDGFDREVPAGALSARPSQWRPPCQTPAEYNASRASRHWLSGSRGARFPVAEVAGVTAGAWISCGGLAFQMAVDDVDGHPNEKTLAIGPGGIVPMRITVNGHVVQDSTGAGRPRNGLGVPGRAARMAGRLVPRRRQPR